MTKKFLSTPPPRTHFLWWFAAIFCAILTMAIIIAGIVVFVGYMVIHPRVPVISVVGAYLPHFNYDGAGVLVTQVNIVVRSRNDNMKAHARFSNFNIELFFDGNRIAVLSTATPYEVKKNSSVDFNYEYTSDPIPLNPVQMNHVDESLKKDEVSFELKGGVRAQWRVGVLGSVKFPCHLNCQLQFHASNGSYIKRRCSSRSK
ncbi:NDR1/HIN1-like protein 12 [Populus alba x Populus x berolinensis]|nr:NDR1/HIN1-like protein 12 [Populus alba x Populus x berolinensis]